MSKPCLCCLQEAHPDYPMGTVQRLHLVFEASAEIGCSDPSLLVMFIMHIRVLQLMEAISHCTVSKSVFKIRLLDR